MNGQRCDVMYLKNKLSIFFQNCTKFKTKFGGILENKEIEPPTYY